MIFTKIKEDKKGITYSCDIDKLPKKIKDNLSRIKFITLTLSPRK